MGLRELAMVRTEMHGLDSSRYCYEKNLFQAAVSYHESDESNCGDGSDTGTRAGGLR